MFFFFSSRRRHTRFKCDWSSDVCSSDLTVADQHRLSVDDLLPSKIMHPGDAEDAARGLRLCDLTPASVVVWGGGTQMRLGAPPRRYDIAFSTERMTRLLEYEAADLTRRVEAGMPVVHLQAARGGPGP